MTPQKRQHHKTVLIVASHFPPCATVSVHRTLRFVKFLREFGWKPVVLALKESSYISDEPIDFAMLQKIPHDVKVYRAMSLNPMTLLIRARNKIIGKRQTPNSKPETIQREKKNRSVSASIKEYIQNLFKIPDSEIGWLPLAVIKGLYLISRKHIDVIYTTAPPHSTHLIGLCLKILTFKPWITDFRDPWTRRPWLSLENRRGMQYKFESLLEALVVKLADKVILNTEYMRQEFIAHYKNCSEGRFIAIPNGFDPNDFIEIHPQNTIKKKFVMTHAGSLYRKRNPYPFLKAIHRLQKRGIVDADNFQVNLVGLIYGFDAEAMIHELGLEKIVRLIPPVSHRESLQFSADSDVLLIIQPGTGMQIPAKIFEYIYLRKPILALTGNGATAEMVMKNGLGIVVSPDSVEEIEDGILELYRNYREGKTLEIFSDVVLKMYDGRRLTGELSKVLDNLIARISG